MARWLETFPVADVWKDEDTELPVRGAIIADRMLARWPENDEIQELAEELRDASSADDVRWFDLVWNGFYDWADANRVWVDTFGKATS